MSRTKMSSWAQDFYQIQETVNENTDLKSDIAELVRSEPIHGKVIEGEGRAESLREILLEFFEGDIELGETYRAVALELPRGESLHASNNRVFASGWDERLVRTQASRFYNQAVLQTLAEQDEQTCHIPHSSEEKSDSPCTRILAGGEADVELMLDRLERTYGQADYHGEVKIPEHPHCTHTITPSN